MQKVTLQVPMNGQLKLAAEKVALDQGFSSLQEVLRIFMKKFANKTIDISFAETIILSDKADKRYQKMTADFKSGRNVYSASSTKDLMKQLNGN
jgi:antitoxin component of RelBE/YafQ-DinJ toxin-antitoxin module